MSEHTPGPWRCGSWGGLCRVPAHVAVMHHPGPPACIYEPVFYPTEGECFTGIVSAEPNVSVVWTEYDELKIRPEDARLIAAAPELLAACRVIVAFHDQYFPLGRPLAIDGVAIDHTLLNHAHELAQDAIKKAEGR